MLTRAQGQGLDNEWTILELFDKILDVWSRHSLRVPWPLSVDKAHQDSLVPPLIWRNYRKDFEYLLHSYSTLKHVSDPSHRRRNALLPLVPYFAKVRLQTVFVFVVLVCADKVLAYLSKQVSLSNKIPTWFGSRSIPEFPPSPHTPQSRRLFTKPGGGLSKPRFLSKRKLN